MPLGVGEFRSGGRVWKAGKQVVTTTLEAGSYRSGGRVFTPDGKEVVVVATENAALGAGQFKSGGEVFDTDGRRVVVASANPTRTHDNQGRRILSTSLFDGLSVVEPPPVVVRGPTATSIPPGTPAYATPANYVAATWADVQTRHDALTDTDTNTSGYVIEYTGPDIEVASVLAGGNHLTRTKNVLIRPPLGQRRTMATGSLNAHRVTLAGFNHGVVGTNYMSRLAANGHHSWYWRVVATSSLVPHWGLRSVAAGAMADSTGFMDCVKPYWQTRGDDSINIVPGTNEDSRNTQFINCYISPSLALVVPKEIDQTGVNSLYVERGYPIDFPTAGAGWNLHGGGSGALAAGVPVAAPPPAPTAQHTMNYNDATAPTSGICAWVDNPVASPLSVDVTVNGTLYATLNFVAPDYKYALVRNTTKRTWLATDVITITPSRNVTGLHVRMGADAQANGTYDVDKHTDIVQTYSEGSVGDVLGGQFRNCILGETNSNHLFQPDRGTTGDWVWDNCFLGRWVGGGLLGHAGDSLVGATPAENYGVNRHFAAHRHYIAGCEFQGTLRASNDGSIALFKNNSYANTFGTADQYLPDATNTARGAGNNPVTPPMPNLATLWAGECPITL